jgi:hypothetical protein
MEEISKRGMMSLHGIKDLRIVDEAKGQRHGLPTEDAQKQSHALFTQEISQQTERIKD